MALIEIHLLHKRCKSLKMLAVTNICADFIYFFFFFLVQDSKPCVKPLAFSRGEKGWAWVLALAAISQGFRQLNLLCCLNIQQKSSCVTLISPGEQLICLSLAVWQCSCIAASQRHLGFPVQGASPQLCIGVCSSPVPLCPVPPQSLGQSMGFLCMAGTGPGCCP